MQMLELKPERRVAERIELKRLAKVMHHPSHRYLPARTRNLSTTGALVEVLTSRPRSATASSSWGTTTSRRRSSATPTSPATRSSSARSPPSVASERARRARRLLRRALHGRDRRHAHARPRQVILPDLSAGCSMADMAAYDDTVDAWDEIHEALRTRSRGRLERAVIPITYVNSSAAIKAFVGAHGGACCTSSNADRVFEWAMNGGETPKAARRGDQDPLPARPAPRAQHRRTSTASTSPNRSVRLRPQARPQGRAVGGSTPEQIARRDVILWAGHCSVHKLFRPEHCDEIRAANEPLEPGRAAHAILVHPECARRSSTRPTSRARPSSSSNTLEAAEPGTRWAVGTEVHLVNRMRRDGRARRRGADPQRLPVPVHDDVPHRQPHLLWVLDGLCASRRWIPTPQWRPGSIAEQ
jgi:hypothetical protein